jgi:hypothetical protein
MSGNNISEVLGIVARSHLLVGPRFARRDQGPHATSRPRRPNRLHGQTVYRIKGDPRVLRALWWLGACEVSLRDGAPPLQCRQRCLAELHL